MLSLFRRLLPQKVTMATNIWEPMHRLRPVHDHAYLFYGEHVGTAGVWEVAIYDQEYKKWWSTLWGEPYAILHDDYATGWTRFMYLGPSRKS